MGYPPGQPIFYNDSKAIAYISNIIRNIIWVNSNLDYTSLENIIPRIEFVIVVT